MFCFAILLWLAGPMGGTTVTLTAPSSPLCFGQTYKLTCTHPVLEGDTSIGWERNGTGFIPRSTPNHNDEGGNTPTTTTLTINVTREEFENKVYTYRCFTYDGNVGFNDPNRTISNEVTVDPPETVAITNVSYQNRSQSNSLFWKVKDPDCFKNISYNITHCMKSNGVADMSSCISNVVYNNRSRGNFTIQPLIPNSQYHVTIQAASIQYPENVSVVLEMDISTLMAHNVTFRPNPVCYDRQVQLTCHHHDITDTTSSGPIFNQTSPVVWMKDGERIDLPDTYHMVVSRNNTETVVNVTTRKSVFLNGETNYSSAVVYVDGSMEESEPVTVRVRESPLPPTSLTSVPSDTSISLMWSHSDECFENCTFMYEVTWQQSGDGSSLGNTTTNETSYTIEGLTPGTSYEIGVGAYCEANPNIRSEIRNNKTTLSPPASTVAIGVAVGVSISLIVLVVFIVLAVVCIMVLRVRHKSKQSFGEAASKVWKNGMRKVTTNQVGVVKEKCTQVLVQDDNQPEEEDESASNHPSGLSQEKVECKYAEVDHTRGAKPRNIPNDNYGDGKYDEVNSKKPPKEETTSGVGDGGKDTHEIKGDYVTVDHLKGEKPRHQPNPNLGDGQYAEIKTASEEFAFEEAKSEMVNDQTSRLEKPTSDAELRAGGIAFEEMILVGTKKIDEMIFPTQETKPFEFSRPIFPRKMQFNHWRDVCVPTFHLRPITCNQLPTTNPIAGGEEEEVLQCSTTTSFTSDVIPAVAPLLVITQDSSSSDDLSSGNKAFLSKMELSNYLLASPGYRRG